MKKICFCCGTDMKDVNDYSSDCWGIMIILRCPKCGSYMQYTLNKDGFIQDLSWKLHYDWDKDKKS